MRAYIRIVGQNFAVGEPYVLYDGYTWDGVSGHVGAPINAPSVPIQADDSDKDIQARVVAAAAAFLALPKHAIVLY
jgi:hypothetical protein